MKRRDLLLGAGVAAVAPIMARAQAPGRIYRLGRLAPGPNPIFTNFFIDELAKAGFVRGRNLEVDER